MLRVVDEWHPVCCAETNGYMFIFMETIIYL